MHYFIYPSKDATIYSGSVSLGSSNKMQSNTGMDAILEIDKRIQPDYLEDNYSRALIQFDTTEFENLVSTGVFSNFSTDVRYYLNGLLIEYREGKILAVATDGHRMALAEENLKDGGSLEGTRYIIPRKAVLELSKILKSEGKEIEIGFGTSSLRVKDEDLDFCTKLIDGKFPDYDKVLPPGDPNKLLISKEDLQSALSRASVLSNEKYRGVRFQLSKDKLTLTANNPEKESAEEVLDVNYEGPPMEIGFNIGYILDVLSTIDTENVQINLYGEESSCTIQEPENQSEVYVIMPMRL